MWDRAQMPENAPQRPRTGTDWDGFRRRSQAPAYPAVPRCSSAPPRRSVMPRPVPSPLATRLCPAVAAGPRAATHHRGHLSAAADIERGDDRWRRPGPAPSQQQRPPTGVDLWSLAARRSVDVWSPSLPTRLSLVTDRRPVLCAPRRRTAGERGGGRAGSLRSGGLMMWCNGKGLLEIAVL